MPNGWIFKGRRGGCPLYVYLEDEEARDMRQRKLRELAAGGDPAIPLAIYDVRPEYLKAPPDKTTIKLFQGRNH